MREPSCILSSRRIFAGIQEGRARAKSSFIHRKYEQEFTTHNFIVSNNCYVFSPCWECGTLYLLIINSLMLVCCLFLIQIVVSFYIILSVLYFSQPIGIFSFKGFNIYLCSAMYCFTFSINNEVGSTFEMISASVTLKKQL